MPCRPRGARDGDGRLASRFRPGRIPGYPRDGAAYSGTARDRRRRTHQRQPQGRARYGVRRLSRRGARRAGFHCASRGAACRRRVMGSGPIPVGSGADHPKSRSVSLKTRYGEIAAHVYGEPSRALHMVGGTGTNGKTSVAHWVSQAFTQLGRKASVVGTVGNGFPPVGDKPGALTPALNTTPDAIELQQRLAAYLQQGAAACAMEVSSHGLAQGRVNGTRFNVAVFINF